MGTVGKIHGGWGVKWQRCDCPTGECYGSDSATVYCRARDEPAATSPSPEGEGATFIDFDGACNQFSAFCRMAADWKHEFSGAAYRSRVDAAFAKVKEAYEIVCKADDIALGRPTPEPAMVGGEVKPTTDEVKASGYRGFDGFQYSEAQILRARKKVARIIKWWPNWEPVTANEAVWYLDDQRCANWRELDRVMKDAPASATSPADRRAWAERKLTHDR